MTILLRGSSVVALALGASLVLAGCGKSVSGSTYEGGGGAVKIEFQSDGKAVMSIGPLATGCTYTENSKLVTLTCEGQPATLTINDDGSLSGPPEGMLGKLTKKQS